MRIGIVGTLNSRAPQIVTACNVETRFGEHHVTDIATSTPERDAELCGIDPGLSVHARPEGMVGAVDLAIVLERDGRQHRQIVEPFLDAGVPTFVDKPLATTRADAEALLARAEETGTLLTSWSAVRFAPGVDRAVERCRGTELQELVLAGPAAHDDPHAGLFFYGPHLVETALVMLGDDEPLEATIEVEKVGETVVARLRSAAGVRISLHFVTPVDGEPSTRNLLVVGDRVVHSEALTLASDYNLDTLRRLLSMVEGSTPALPPRDLVAPVALLECIVQQLGATP